MFTPWFRNRTKRRPLAQLHGPRRRPFRKIVVVGSTSSVSGGTNFALARYHADGTRDNTFSNGGRVTTDCAGSADIARSVAIQPTDGKIVVAGEARVGGVSGNIDFALARYNPDGSLDETFGSNANGKVTINFAGGLNDVAQ